MAETESPDGYMVATQSFSSRVWQRLGFGFAFVPFDDDDGTGGCITSEITTVWDWRDRLRILISGKTSCMIRYRTEEPVRVREPIIATRVIPPGRR